MSHPVAIAKAAWGTRIPDWVLRLADECAMTSQNKVASELGRSAALVSNVLNNKYRGDMAAVEDLVRGRYMNATVTCPALGVISTALCRDWMAASRIYSNANSEQVRMHRACRSCPRLTKEVSS